MHYFKYVYHKTDLNSQKNIKQKNREAPTLPYFSYVM